MIAKLNFQLAFLQSSMSQDPSEIILMIFIDLVVKHFLSMLKTVFLWKLPYTILSVLFDEHKEQHFFRSFFIIRIL